MGKVKEFKSDVLHEINMLKQHAFKTELERLDFRWFNPHKPSRCIYGQMTGNCANKRAEKLMNLSCIRVMDLPSGVSSIDEIPIASKKFNVNGIYDKQTWGKRGRNYGYLSALEGYICTKDANIEGILQYMKGETDTLKL